jgi:hypothetical protein
MNKQFVIHDATGVILRTGNCPEEDWALQVTEGEGIIEAQACCINDAVNLETGEIIYGGATPQPAPTVASQPVGLSTATQLDLLWQAMDAGTFPKAEPFYSAIKAQKDAAT